MTIPKPKSLKLSSPASHEFWEIPVLYEDDQLLALDKPAGLLTSPDRYDPVRPNLMQLVRRDIERGAPFFAQRQITYLANSQRLGADTSGILLLAKTKAAMVSLVNQLTDEKPHKIFLALAHGLPETDTFSIDATMAPNPVNPGRMQVDRKKGKKAITHFEVVERFREYVLLRCQPLTERPHQISVHLQYLRFPLVGDTHYGGYPLLLSGLKPRYKFKPEIVEHPLLGRGALHASQLSVVHPATGEPLTITCPQPKDFEVALKYLRCYGKG